MFWERRTWELLSGYFTLTMRREPSLQLGGVWELLCVGSRTGARSERISRTSPCSPGAPDLVGKLQGPREHEGRCVDGSTYTPFSGNSQLVFL